VHVEPAFANVLKTSANYATQSWDPRVAKKQLHLQFTVASL